MATLESYDWESGANGAPITQKGEGLNLVQGAWTYSSNRDPSGGARSAHLVASGASAGINGLSTWAGQGDVFARIDVNFAAVSAATFTFAQFRSAATPKAELRITGTGAVQLRRGSDFVAIATSPDGLVVANANLRINWSYDTNAGRQRVQVFKGANFAGVTPDYDSGLVATSASGTVDGWYLGAVTGATFDAYVGNLVFDDARFPAGPAGPNQPPVCDAGSDQSVTAGATVTLSATDSDADGTIVSRQWAQTGGPRVTLSGAGTGTATFTAPLLATPATLTFSYTVVDDTGATATDAVAVAVAASGGEAVTVVGTFTASSTAQSAALAVPVTAAAAAGSTLLLAAVRDDAAGAPGGVASIVDSRGNTWALHDAVSLRAGLAEVSWHHAHLTTALQAGDTITVTWNANRARKLAVCHVVAGLATGGADATSGTVVAANPANTGPTGANSTTVSGATAGPTDASAGLLVAAVAAGSTGGVFTPGATFAAGAQLVTAAGAGDRRLATEYRTTSAAGVKTADGTLASATTWAEAVAHYQAAATNVAPTAVAGADQVNVEPWAAVTVGGVDSDPDGTVTGIVWTQVAGAPVSLSATDTATVTFEAPATVAGTTVILQKQVTDDAGATSPPASVSVTVLPATELRVRDGQLVPMRLTRVGA